MEQFSQHRTRSMFGTKHMRKRLMSLFAAAVMVFCSVMPESLAVHASDTITRIVVSGIKQPFSGATPVSDPAAYTLDIPDKAEIAWVKWVAFDTVAVVDKTARSLDDMLYTDKFRPKTNCVPVLFIGVNRKQGYFFSDTVEVFRDSADSLNNRLTSDWKGTLREYDIDYPDCDLVCSYEHALNSPTIKEVTISGVTEPMMGGQPALSTAAYST